MNRSNRYFELRPTTLFLTAGLIVLSGPLTGAELNLANEPLSLMTSADPNIILAIDDSGSMDFETLFLSNDGVLHWNDTIKSFVGADAPGQVNFESTGKYGYIFPNGSGSGNRANADFHYGIPPLPQYAFARSADYNKAYYNPTITYEPWTSFGTTVFPNIDPTDAPSDPRVTSSQRHNLTAITARSEKYWNFYLRAGMVLPQGTEYANQGSSSWQTAGSDITLGYNANYGIKYYPATYYMVSDTGSYTVKNTSGNTISGNCASPNTTHYGYFERRPSSFSSSGGIAALAPDGQCLREVKLQSTDAEMQNFANWFSYYRKRHLALRAGMGQAFNELSSVRVGWFPINNRTDITMLDMDTRSQYLIGRVV